MSNEVRRLGRIRQLLRASLARQAQARCSDSGLPPETPLECPAKERGNHFAPLEHRIPEPAVSSEPIFDDFSELLTESPAELPGENTLALAGQRIYGPVIFPEPTFDESLLLSPQEESARFAGQSDGVSSRDRDLALLIASGE